MGFFKFLKRQNPNPKAKPYPVKTRYVNISKGYSGKDTTSFATIDRIASELAMLSYGIYDAKTHKKIDKHPLYAVLKQPNLEDLHFNFFYQTVVDYFNGGVFWLKGYGTEHQVVSLFRLASAEVTVSRDINTNTRLFSYHGKKYTDKDIIYIPSRFDYSTLYGGSSIFKAASGAFDTAQKLDSFTNSSFDKGISGKRLVIDISGAIADATDEQIDELRNKYEATYAGPDNAGKPLFKKKGVEYSEIGQNTDNRAATLIENREFQEHEIAKLFGFPGELLSGKSAGVDIENLFILLSEFAIKPIATQLQEAINLLLEDNCYFEFNYNGMLKVSLTKRIEAYAKQINNGLLSPNEARAKENMSPIEAGDNWFIPANFMPLNKETIEAYMAKQKLTAKGLNNSPNNDNSDQHSPAGDDKQ